MIKHWNELCKQIEITEKSISEFGENTNLSPIQHKKLQKYIADWNKIKKMVENFEQYIEPFEPVTIKSPFNNDDFLPKWKTWKEYLREQHLRVIKSRMEQESLDYLAEISEGNAVLAASYLRYAMANGYRSFFKVETKDKANPAKPDRNGSDF